MNLRDLEYLQLVDKHKNFGKAAKDGNISQPALSMQISKLEKELGVIIFERNNKKIITTNLGKELLVIAKNILAEKDRMIKTARSSIDPFAGEIRIASFPTLAPYLFPQIIPAIFKDLPKLKLYLIEEKTSEILSNLVAGQIDCALLALPIANKGLEFKKLFTDQFYLAVNKKDSLAKKKFITQEDLFDNNLLLLDEGHCLREQALEVCSIMGINENYSFRASSLETLRQMIVAEMGMTLIPQIALDSNQLIAYIPFKAKAPSREIALVYRKSSARKKCFLHIAEIINQQISANGRNH